MKTTDLQPDLNPMGINNKCWVQVRLEKGLTQARFRLGFKIRPKKMAGEGGGREGPVAGGGGTTRGGSAALTSVVSR